jgi:hypothetical protein
MLDFLKKKKDADNKNPMDPKNMGMLQRMAMKKVMAMSQQEREQLMKKVMTPQNISKNKKQILETLEQLEKTGQMNKHQIFEAKKRLGLL